MEEKDTFVDALTAPEIRFTYGIDFSTPAIGNHWYSWSLDADMEVARIKPEMNITPARNFCLLHQIEYLQRVGLIKGGSVKNLLVCSP